MKILLSIPTEVEINNKIFSEILADFKPQLIITGIGSINTTFNLTKYLLNNNIELVIHGGIAGALKEKLTLGSVFQVVEDVFADYGINVNGIITNEIQVFDNNVFKNNEFKKLSLPCAKGITLNSITLSDNIKSYYLNKYNADIETMENAAIFYVCSKLNIPFYCFRSISNYVGDRNKQNWKIDLAVENLWLTLKEVFKVLHNE